MAEVADVYEPIHSVLDQDDPVRARTRGVDADVVVTDRRLVVWVGDRIALNVEIDAIRRIQFDIETGRPATLVIVPHKPTDTPQVLAIPVEEYQSSAQALAFIGQRLAEQKVPLRNR